MQTFRTVNTKEMDYNLLSEGMVLWKGMEESDKGIRSG